MYEWEKSFQMIINEIDKSISNYSNESLTLRFLSKKLGYSEFYTTKKFKEILGMTFRDYLRQRKLAFAFKEVRDNNKSIIEIAFDYGFSSHEAFTRAFKSTFGITPSDYRKDPIPIVLRTKLTPYDRYFLGLEEIVKIKKSDNVKTYFVTISAHKFLYIENKESNGYWDFWDKQKDIKGQDYETICGLLDSVKGKLDDYSGEEANSGSGQLMAYISNPEGRLCDWGFSRTECYGARLPSNYQKAIPSQMKLMDIPESEYLVFEHGEFDYEQENRSVEEKMEIAMETFDFNETGYTYDTSVGRIMYFYFDPSKYWKYIRPVKKIK